jgi:hypothetical protein
MCDKSASHGVQEMAKDEVSMEADPAELARRDWGFGKLRIWAVKGYSPTGKGVVSLTTEALCAMERDVNPFQFFQEEIYLFLFEYKERPSAMADTVLAERLILTKKDLENLKDSAVLYTWVGSQCTVVDKAFAANVAVELDKWINDGQLAVSARPKHVRVTEGKEPVHLLNLVCGGNVPRDQGPELRELLTRAVPPPSPVFVIQEGSLDVGMEEKRLYHVVGNNEDIVRIGQVSVCASELCSAHAYVLLDSRDGVIYVWRGTGAFDWEFATATVFAEKILSRESKEPFDVKQITEGKEPSEFWTALGGKLAYDESSKYHLKLDAAPRYESILIIHFKLASLQSNPTRKHCSINATPLRHASLADQLRQRITNLNRNISVCRTRPT